MRMGIELEGAWDTKPPAGDSYVQDGSVKVRGSWKRGEIPSDILQASEWDTVSEFITENYPDHVGPSCGLHVHYSFGSRARMQELREYFQRADILRLILDRLERWGKRKKIQNESFYSRLRGENAFCRTEEWTGCRYHAMNFEALHAHGTIEIRVLAAFYQSSAALSAIAELTRIMSRVYSVVLRAEARALAFEQATIEPDPPYYVDEFQNTTTELMLQGIA